VVTNQFKKVFTGPRQAVVDVMNRAETDIQNYWKMNIYNYFNARSSHGLPNTGQMGKSLRIKINGTRMEFGMIPLHNERTQYFKPSDFPRMPTFSGAMSFSPFNMPGVGFGGRMMDTDYGKLMREGIKPSHGSYYSFEHDCRIDSPTGSHPGYDPKTRWVPWMDDFGGNAKQILADHMMDEMEKAGVRPKGRWKVDIVI
jgi:hypothetical protein